MKEKPILFNTEMVRAILDGSKTVTRRIIKRTTRGLTYEDGSPARTPPVDPGDILWVRETWSTTDDCGLFPPWPIKKTVYMYKADAPDSDAAKEARWHPSIHMPREAARIFLRVKGVTKERLQDIPERGPRSAQAEGFTNNVMEPGGKSATKRFMDLWDTTIRKEDLDDYGQDANPWVWVIEFERERR